MEKQHFIRMINFFILFAYIIILLSCNIYLVYHMWIDSSGILFPLHYNIFKSASLVPLLLIGFLAGLGSKYDEYESWILKNIGLI